MKKVIGITGRNGFIGKHLFKYLNKLNFEVISLSLQNNKIQNSISRLDTIIHLAARTYVPDSFNNPKKYYLDNYVSTLNSLELAKNFCSNFIFFSSYIYGNPKYIPINEMHPLRPHNPYAQSKYICEKLCYGYYRDYNIPMIILRPFNIYGPKQNKLFLIPYILNQLKLGEIKINDPRPKRDYIFITDVIDVILKIIERPIDNFKIFNVGYGKSYSVSQLIEIICKIFKINPKIVYTNNYRKGEIFDTQSDISLISNELSWRPKINLSEGIKMIKDNL